MQAYSNPKRETDPHALPDLETFKVTRSTPVDECPLCADRDEADESDHAADHVGWYWQACFPGCLPDGEPTGPFATEAEALADAREGISEDELPPCDWNAAPLCVQSMGCLCAWHACGGATSDPCDANEERAKQAQREREEEE